MGQEKNTPCLHTFRYHPSGIDRSDLGAPTSHDDCVLLAIRVHCSSNLNNVSGGKQFRVSYFRPPLAGWFIMENPNQKSMIWGYPHDLGNPQWHSIKSMVDLSAGLSRFCRTLVTLETSRLKKTHQIHQKVDLLRRNPWHLSLELSFPTFLK